MSTLLTLRNADFQKETEKGQFIGIDINVDGHYHGQHSVWLPKRFTSQTKSGYLQLPSWLVQELETTIAKELSCKTVEILVFERE